MDLSRQIALDILIAWDRASGYPDLLLKEKLKMLPGVQERSFCTSLVYGTIENKLRLDFWIKSVSSTPFSKIHIVNRNILRLGLQQIAYMNVPASAACNTSVALAKKNGQFRSAGFVNAILRKLSGERAPLPEGNDGISRSIHYSVDPSIIELLDRELSPDFTDTYFKSLFALPPEQVTVAVNPLRTDAARLAASLTAQGCTVSEQSEELLTVRFGISPSETNAYKKGWFHVIGKPSFETAAALDVRPGQTVIDMCAAPGGKTFAMAYKMQNTGRIIALDVHPHKVDLMEREAKRLGLTNIECVCHDATAAVSAWQGTADRVLCDVPCSGLGIIRKKPDIRYKNMNDFSLYDTQRQILQNGLGYLMDNGRLVYSTCTVNPLENEKIIENAAKIEAAKTYLPQTDQTEGFFLSVLKKG